MQAEAQVVAKSYGAKVDDAAVAARIAELCFQHGSITPEMVLEEAKPKTSVLHNCFEWDDTEAGRKYRLWQARNLITSVRVVYETKPPERVYVRVETAPARYKTIENVTVAERDVLIAEAARGLRAWLNRYHELSERLPSVYQQAQMVLEGLQANVPQA
jgi:hypothetical protein